MVELVGPNGKRLRPRPDKNKRHEVLANEAMLNLVARVQNLEAVIIMLATTVEEGVYDESVKRDLNIYMEAFFKAQTQRGASHLTREITDDNPAVFV